MALAQQPHFAFMKWKASNYLNNHLFHINYTPVISQLGECLFLWSIVPHILFVLSFCSFSPFAGGSCRWGGRFASIHNSFGETAQHVSNLLNMLWAMLQLRIILCELGPGTQQHSQADLKVLLHSNKHTLIHIFFFPKCKESHLYCKCICTFFTVMQSVQSHPYYVWGALSGEQGGHRLCRMGYGKCAAPHWGPSINAHSAKRNLRHWITKCSCISQEARIER